jgi:hypothetical protein
LRVKSGSEVASAGFGEDHGLAPGVILRGADPQECVTDQGDRVREEPLGRVDALDFRLVELNGDAPEVATWSIHRPRSPTREPLRILSLPMPIQRSANVDDLRCDDRAGRYAQGR